jgi:nicotinate-nucleotide adenylyltransferase
MKRIGLFGGTFNPIHFGHLRAAQEVKDRFGMDEVYLIPSAIPPHKSSEDIADAEDRLEMVRLATAECKDMRISDIELNRPGPSYTVDTIRHFKSVFSEDTELFFIVGIDAFLEINLWYAYDELFLLIPFIVMTRPGYDAKGTQNIGRFLCAELSDAYQYAEDSSAYFHPEKQPVYVFKADFLNISSTEIRNRIRQGRSVRSLLPEKVENFIREKKLFL